MQHKRFYRLISLPTVRVMALSLLLLAFSTPLAVHAGCTSSPSGLSVIWTCTGAVSGTITGLGHDDNFNFDDTVTGSLIIDAGGITTAGEHDELNFSSVTKNVTVNLSNQTGYQTVFTGLQIWFQNFTQATILGGEGSDALTGTSGNDILQGGNGDDRLYGEDGDDTLQGGADSDILYGGSGDDSIQGGSGVDEINLVIPSGDVTLDLNNTTTPQNTGQGNDTVQGIENVLTGGGNDTIIGDGSNNTFDTGPGNDTVYGGGGDDVIYGASGIDTLHGGAGNDKLYGESGDSDTLFGDEGDDRLDGGTGSNDWIEDDSNNTLYINLSTGVATGSGTDTLIGIENVDVQGGNDTIIGSANNNILWGGQGNDTITGGEGADEISGGPGTDTRADTIAADCVDDTLIGVENDNCAAVPPTPTPAPVTGGSAPVGTDICITQRTRVAIGERNTLLIFSDFSTTPNGMIITQIPLGSLPAPTDAQKAENAWVGLISKDSEFAPGWSIALYWHESHYGVTIYKDGGKTVFDDTGAICGWF